MKHKTWFRLVLKAIGIYLLAQSIPNLVSMGYSLVTELSHIASVGSGPMTGNWAQYMVRAMLPVALQFGIGCYLLFRGQWIVNLCIPSNRPYCPDCGYDISKSHGAVCPECGARLDSISRSAPDSTPSGGGMP